MNLSKERECGYESILYFPHYTSFTHPRMTSLNRAAQFSAFAALTGYDAAVFEASRFTETKKELDENRKEELNSILQKIKADINTNPQISVTFFKKDKTKPGGKYFTITDNLEGIDIYNQELVFSQNLKIKIDDIYDIIYPL